MGKYLLWSKELRNVIVLRGIKSLDELVLGVTELVKDKFSCSKM